MAKNKKKESPKIRRIKIVLKNGETVYENCTDWEYQDFGNRPTVVCKDGNGEETAVFVDVSYVREITDEDVTNIGDLPSPTEIDKEISESLKELATKKDADVGKGAIGAVERLRRAKEQMYQKSEGEKKDAEPDEPFGAKPVDTLKEIDDLQKRFDEHLERIRKQSPPDELPWSPYYVPHPYWEWGSHWGPPLIQRYGFGCCDCAPASQAWNGQNAQAAQTD